MSKFKLFIVIVALALGGAGYWYYQKNSYSKEVLKLEILGPSSADLLEEVEYAVKYKNNGDFNLEDAKLNFECPGNSLECFVAGKEGEPEQKKSLRKEFQLSTIYPGEEKTFLIKARLLGQENEVREAKAELSYHPKNLKAVYESETTFTTQIKKPLLNFEFDLPSKAESGRELKFSLNYFSNLDYPLSNIGVKLEYPSGFQFALSKPKALEKTDFEIKSLNRTDGGRIEIQGQLSGEVGEQKVFRATFGVWKDGEFIVLKEATRGVEIAEPALYISQLINGSLDYAAHLGDLLHYELYFRNLGKSSFENLSLITKLEGELFDLQSVKSDSGEYALGDNTLVWDWKKIPELKFLDSGKEGKVEFWVNLKNDIQPINGEALGVKNEVILPGQTKKEFLTKIGSKLLLAQKGYVGDEFFNSQGPVPPGPGQKSYFTIAWEAQNLYSKVSNVKVKAVLPPLVELTGKIYPATSSFTFDSNSREMIWQIGDMEPGQAKELKLAFQVALELKEGEKEPTLLISPAEISGEDKWTAQVLSASSSPVYTRQSELIIGEAVMPYYSSSTTSPNE